MLFARLNRTFAMSKQNSVESPIEAGGSGGGDDKKAKKGKKGSGKSSKFQGDIFSEGAMENAYYLCHNIQDVLKNRGFPWPDAQKKKKKK